MKRFTEYKIARDLGSRDFVVLAANSLPEAQVQAWDSLLTESEKLLLCSRINLLYYLNGVAYAQRKIRWNGSCILSNRCETGGLIKNLEVQFYTGLGDTYRLKRFFKKSEKITTKHWKLDPKTQILLNNYAYYLSIRRKSWKKGGHECGKQCSWNQPGFYPGYVWLDYVQTKAKYKDAKIWIEKALSNTLGKERNITRTLVTSLFKMGDTLKALEYWQQAKDAGRRDSSTKTSGRNFRLIAGQMYHCWINSHGCTAITKLEFFGFNDRTPVDFLSTVWFSCKTTRKIVWINSRSCETRRSWAILCIWQRDDLHGYNLNGDSEGNSWLHG